MIRRTFGVWFILAIQSAGAGWIDFQPPADLSTATLSFGLDGSLSGSIPIATILGESTPRDAGRTIPLMGGQVNFTFGPAIFLPAGYVYHTGSMVITGILPGHGESETLFSEHFFSCQISPLPLNRWAFVDPVLGFGTTNPAILSTFGVTDDLDYFYLEFSGVPGDDPTIDSALIQLQATSGVPEPPSLPLLGLSLGVVFFWWFWTGKTEPNPKDQDPYDHFPFDT